MKADIDPLLVRLRAEIDAARKTDLPSCVISGAVRCGKSKVAQQLARKHGYLRLATDQIRNATYRGCSNPDKRRIAKYLFRRILLENPQGLLIEGTGAMDADPTLPLWAARHGIAFFAIGYSFDRPKAKQHDLLAYRAAQPCWTQNSKSDAEMLQFARRLIRRSQSIKSFCATHGLPYYDLDSRLFTQERDRIVADILRHLTTQRENAPSGEMARNTSNRH